MLLTVHCTGVSPLLMHAMSEDTLIALWEKRKAPKGAARPSIHDACTSCLYTDAQGGVVMPTPNIYSALAEAGRHVRLEGKKMVSSLKATLLPSFLTLIGESVPLRSTSGGAPQWRPDVRKGTNPNGGEAVAIVRPRFDDWSFVVSAEIDLTETAETTIRELFDKAGSRVGLGGFRPQRKGPFGRFAVTSWAIQEVALAAE